MNLNSLTPPQLRRIRITLRSLEETLRKADRLLSDGDFNGILYSYKIQMDYEKQRIIHDKIVKTLAYLEEFSKKLGAEPFEYSVERIILGELSISWENMEECRPKRLKGYGAVKPQAAELVDSAIDYLVDAILDISKQVRPDVQEDELADKDK